MAGQKGSLSSQKSGVGGGCKGNLPFQSLLLVPVYMICPYNQELRSVTKPGPNGGGMEFLCLKFLLP